MAVEKNFERVIVIPDLHIPYEDSKTVSTALQFVEDQKPDRVVLIGDVLDMYSVSKFEKDPSRAFRLQDEFDQANAFLQHLRTAAGDVPITLIEGNHEKRLSSYLKRHPELHGLRDLSIPSQLGLKDLKIDYVTELFHKKFLFTHGRRFGMYASRWELADNGVSGMAGHTHRVGTFSKTERGVVKAWYHIGHMCDPKTAGEYRPNPDWQQGIGIVDFEKRGGRFYAQAIPIVKNKFIFGNTLYTPKGIKSLE